MVRRLAYLNVASFDVATENDEDRPLLMPWSSIMILQSEELPEVHENARYAVIATAAPGVRNSEGTAQCTSPVTTIPKYLRNDSAHEAISLPHIHSTIPTLTLKTATPTPTDETLSTIHDRATSSSPSEIHSMRGPKSSALRPAGHHVKRKRKPKDPPISQVLDAQCVSEWLKQVNLEARQKRANRRGPGFDPSSGEGEHMRSRGVQEDKRPQVT